MNASAVSGGCLYTGDPVSFPGTRTGAHAQNYAHVLISCGSYLGGRRLVSICRHRTHQCFVFVFNHIFSAICHFLQFECT